MAEKRVVIISDMHCGHRAGLTPPDWQSDFRAGSKTQRNKFAELQRELWQFYADTITDLRPVDLLVVNGDAIDGKGSLSGGTEQREQDRIEQIDMAAACIQFVEAAKIVMTYGTAYHTGKAEDWELLVANAVNAEKIGSHEWLDVNGVVFDFKHHIGTSSIPHGRFTAIARDKLWNELWASHDEQPKADVLVRSHCHYHIHCGGADWLALTTPALQGMGSKYGSRRCSGRVDVGLVWFDVDDDGSYAWDTAIARLDAQRAVPLSV